MQKNWKTMGKQNKTRQKDRNFHAITVTDDCNLGLLFLTHLSVHAWKRICPCLPFSPISTVYANSCSPISTVPTHPCCSVTSTSPTLCLASRSCPMQLWTVWVLSWNACSVRAEGRLPSLGPDPLQQEYWGLVFAESVLHAQILPLDLHKRTQT